MMFFQRVQPVNLTRLDSEFYSPTALAVDALIRSSAHQPLGSLIKQGYRVVYHGVDDSIPGERLPFLAPTNINSEGHFEISEVEVFVPTNYAVRYAKGVAVANEILIEVKGNTDKVAIVPGSFQGSFMVSGSLYKASLLSCVDTHFVLAFLKSRHGNILKRRVVSNINISYIGKEALYAIPIPTPHPDAQAYIGNKVRQAEMLRARARELMQRVNSALGEALPSHPLKPHMWSRTPTSVLQNRLDPRPYRSHRLALRDAIQEGDYALIKDLVEIKSGNPVPSREFVECGVPLIKNGDIQLSGFSSPTTACVSEEYHRENIGYAAHEGTIVVCLDGEIRSQFFLSYELPAHVNQRVAILKAKTIRPELLTAWLNHPCLQEQLLQWSVQTTVEHISNSIIAGALVPRLKDEEENKLADDVLWSRTAGWISNRLILAAKLLVESLIERRVTEDELVAAHNDSSADRDLMQRLRVDGFDESGSSPLFEDLDRLQELLYEASSSGGSDEV
jgi:type I restriction enzyme S subunit